MSKLRYFLWPLLLPISLLYACVTSFRNLLFDIGGLKSKAFGVKVIVVGNLSVGGTGKSPMIEWLISRLGQSYKIATLSRGYGRTTKGFRYVETHTLASEVGDEPKQFKQKFEPIIVAVAEDRVVGIAQICKDHPEVDLILLDDAFQHRWVRPMLSIVLTDFAKPFNKDWPLPLGRLREWRTGAKRANWVVVTKCPTVLGLAEQREMRHELARYTKAPIYFSRIQFGELQPLQNLGDFDRFGWLGGQKKGGVVAFCGIANPKSFFDFLLPFFEQNECVSFADHHLFEPKDLMLLKQKWDLLKVEEKLIVTTEKDAQRLNELMDRLGNENPLKSLPICYLPIETCLLNEENNKFELAIREMLTSK